MFTINLTVAEPETAVTATPMVAVAPIATAIQTLGDLQEMNGFHHPKANLIVPRFADMRAAPRDKQEAWLENNKTRYANQLAAATGALRKTLDLYHDARHGIVLPTLTERDLAEITKQREQAAEEAKQHAKAVREADENPFAALRKAQQKREGLLSAAADTIPTLSFRRAGEDLTLTPDASQWEAVRGLIIQQYGCVTGAAGTGKTTVQRVFLKFLEQSPEFDKFIDIGEYGKPSPDGTVIRKTKEVPPIAFCAYTGKAMQQMKKALPQEYHGQVSTIHSMLGYYPEFYDDWNEEQGEYVSKRRFIPYYNQATRMPWRIIILDEASMPPIFLWNQIMAAKRDDCRVYLFGDINQLPPIHGKSPFGYAMLAWPSYELTQIHRQKGENNPIVDGAWAILQGKYPVAVKGQFDMIRVSNKKSEAMKTINTLVKALHTQNQFNPQDQDFKQGDMIITSQNKDVLGQVEVNQMLLPYFNPPPDQFADTAKGRRVAVTHGYKKTLFAEGDKVMATVNDHDVGITNGMTGTLVDIASNGKYIGKGMSGGHATGHLSALEEFLASGHASGLTIGPEDQTKGEAVDESSDDFKRRAASHILTIDFGAKEDGQRHVVAFDSVGGVNSLMHAYAATCHKCQGSEFPTVVVVCHSSNHRMLYREWLYTAVTRASKRVVLVYDERGLKLALERQKIKGSTLKEKALAFIEESGEKLDDEGDYTGDDYENAKRPVLPQARRIEA